MRVLMRPGLAMFLLAAGMVPAGAAPLVDIVAQRPCSSIPGDRVGASGNCATTAGPTGLAVTLRAAGGQLPIALPSGIPLAGGGTTGEGAAITVGDLALYNGTLAPEVWRIRAGDTLRVTLRNGLPAGEHAATNLHTHGLLVKPTLPLTPAGRAREPVGDNVHVCTIPEGTAPDGVSAGACGMHGAVFDAEPSRMTYALATRRDHPPGLYWYHPHVHGNSRAQIGAGLSGLIWVDPATPRRPAPREAAAERLLLLRDMQLTDVAASGAGLSAQVMPVEDREADLCAAIAQPLPGACFTPEGKGWLFTVNGQVLPEITVAPGGRETWRIANAGADVTYDLALVEAATGRPLRMRVLAADGAAMRDPGGLTERVLLMPGARIEVAVSRSEAEGGFAEDQPLQAVLRSYGYFTGGAAESGDAWPAVDLARVTFAAAGAVAETPVGPTIVMPHEPAARERAEARESPAMAAHSHAGHATARQAAPDCRPLPAGMDRIIALAIEKPEGEAERFMIGADRARRGDPRAFAAAVDRALGSARVYGDDSVSLCVRSGRTETWTVVNRPQADNNELHNFHIHQMKFEVLEVVDPSGRIAAPTARMVDSYPVPIGGSLRVRLRFDAQQTGGRFVFHCHILEHEDKGMMAEIQVLPR